MPALRSSGRRRRDAGLPGAGTAASPRCVPAGTQPPGIAVLYLLSGVVTSCLQGLAKTEVMLKERLSQCLHIAAPQELEVLMWQELTGHRCDSGSAAGRGWGAGHGWGVGRVVGWPGTAPSRTQATNARDVRFFF